MQVQQFQQRGDGRDFVGLRVDGHLAQRQVLRRGPGADQVQRPEPSPDPEPRSVLPSMATCLIRRASLTARTQSRKQAWNARGSSRSKTRSKVSCDGDAVGQGQEAPQPVAALAAEGLDLLPVLGPAMTRRGR